ncbi:S-adenosyl-L-methionine-dependent methyltransferase [Zopfochytrium polystomum]|nr:S-adenosyl-L-methionine-dependent methyltransferase [Zopfochytrium polystomum]
MGWAAYYEPVLDAGILPDAVVRSGIRHLLSRRADQCRRGNSKTADPTLTVRNAAKTAYVRKLRDRAAIAINTKEANDQHYEVPARFFRCHLGEAMKYSSCFYESGAKTLEEAEIAMLDLYLERADIRDGQHVLDLGCGWGSFCLHAATRFPKSRFTALSNSASQREYINNAAKARGITNVTVYTGDINVFQFPAEVLKDGGFDRIVSVEMFEHMKNFASLLKKVSEWLKPEVGRLFVHVFAHKEMPYDFKTDEDHSWMAKFFFTGGTMPSEDLFLWFQDDLKVLDRWTVDGRNYGSTAEDWLRRLDANKPKALEALAECHGTTELAHIWFQRWRIFYMSVAELFNYDQGQEWIVVHYLFQRQRQN